MIQGTTTSNLMSGNSGQLATMSGLASERKEERAANQCRQRRYKRQGEEDRHPCMFFGSLGVSCACKIRKCSDCEPFLNLPLITIWASRL